MNHYQIPTITRRLLYDGDDTYRPLLKLPANYAASIFDFIQCDSITPADRVYALGIRTLLPLQLRRRICAAFIFGTTMPDGRKAIESIRHNPRAWHAIEFIRQFPYPLVGSEVDGFNQYSSLAELEAQKQQCLQSEYQHIYNAACYACYGSVWKTAVFCAWGYNVVEQKDEHAEVFTEQLGIATEVLKKYAKCNYITTTAR